MPYTYNPFTGNFDYYKDDAGTAGVIYFGSASSDGAWRITISGVNLAVEKRESGSWVEKSAFTP